MKTILLFLLSVSAAQGALTVYPVGDPTYQLNTNQVLVLTTKLHLEGTRKEVRRHLDFYRGRHYKLTDYVRTQTNSIVYIDATYQIPLGPPRVRVKRN